MLWLYIARNFDRLLNLECPEPLANLYTRSYFRATWVTTALDAGFWSAMRIRRRWARDFLSMVFSVYYLFCAEQADQKVRRVRATLSVDHLRVSWNKGTTPYLAFISKLLRPRLMRFPPRAIRIPRPANSRYNENIMAWLYFDRPLSALKSQKKLVLDIPGGGWVAMDPRKHDDKLMAWAAKTGIPVLSLDYKKAPEYPYPYALNECYDAYEMILSSKGRCIGFNGQALPKIVVSGDSAGGNLAVGMTLMILQSSKIDSHHSRSKDGLPLPEGLILIYPALDMNIGNWMSEDQMALIRDRRSRKTNKCILRRKSDDYRQLDPTTPHHSDDDDMLSPGRSSPSKESQNPENPLFRNLTHTPRSAISTDVGSQDARSQRFKTRLAMSSILSYFNDRILTPEMMRAMIILYIGPHHRPDFGLDYLLSPVLAPEQLLAKFPKTYFLTGERDPLVDDTVILAGRIRKAKYEAYQERKALGLVGHGNKFADDEHVEVVLIPGISHGFLQFVGLFPEGWSYIFRAAKWMRELFGQEGCKNDSPFASVRSANCDANMPSRQAAHWSAILPEDVNKVQGRHHVRTLTESSADEDRPLEMTSTRSLTDRKKSGQSPKTPRSTGSEHNPSEEALSSGTELPDRSENVRLRGLGVSTRRRRRRSFASLASEEDLLGRRMKGLTGALVGWIDRDTIPPTPGDKTPEDYF